METPCSDGSRTFYSFTEQRKSQVRASLKYTGGCIREAGAGDGRSFSAGPRCHLRTSFALGLEASASTKTVDYKGFYLLVTGHYVCHRGGQGLVVLGADASPR